MAEETISRSSIVLDRIDLENIEFIKEHTRMKSRSAIVRGLIAREARRLKKLSDRTEPGN